MDISTVDELVTYVRSHFDPVAGRLGLRGPNLEKANLFFKLNYECRPVAVEIVVAMNEFFAFVMLFDNDVKERNGQPRKLYLQQALDKLRIPHAQEAQALRELGGDIGNCGAMSQILAQLLEGHLAKISQSGSGLFTA